ncbi:MAG: DUF4399 domain-containing protein, partial [Pseudomonadales bacterium]|nr:DUF4399 domain-containing protein [Pseudomonadales bacterium]
ADGQVVHSPFLVQFGLSAMGVAPAGVDMPDTGHHHLFIDGDALDLTKPLSSEVMHFGSGQTEALIALPTGRHTLQLILGDTNHLPFSPPVISEVITVVVK